MPAGHGLSGARSGHGAAPGCCCKPSRSTASSAEVWGGWVARKNISFWFATALEGATQVPKDGFPHGRETSVVWCGEGKGRAEATSPRLLVLGRVGASAPFTPNRLHPTQSNPNRCLLNLSQDPRPQARAAERSPAPQSSPDPRPGAGMGRRACGRVRKELNPQHCQPPPPASLLTLGGRE